MMKLLKPTGRAVWIPALSRNIAENGERIHVTAYVDKRIASGALEIVAAEKPLKKNPKTEEAQ